MYFYITRSNHERYYIVKETLHIYTRVSTSIQEEEGTSLITQKEIGIQLSEKIEMNYKVHNEGGISSSKDTLENRPVLLNILRLMDKGEIRHLYVWNTDRLSRNQITWYTIRQHLLIDGKPIGEIDIMCSQPYILSTILNEGFFKHK